MLLAELKSYERRIFTSLYGTCELIVKSVIVQVHRPVHLSLTKFVSQSDWPNRHLTHMEVKCTPNTTYPTQFTHTIRQIPLRWEK